MSVIPVERLEESLDRAAEVPFGGQPLEFGARIADDRAQLRARLLERRQLEVTHDRSRQWARP